MTAFYNEHDPYSAQWLRNLIAAGHIAPGVVDERDIQDIEPYELAEFTQVHMFAGIGVWSAALRRNNWPDDRPIWTGSCPCQPFSNAGKRKGTADDRHLWPVWLNLIGQCRPSIVIGEQVASKGGREWLGAVPLDMEALGFALGASDLCAAGFGQAHLRQRLYFVGLADADDAGLQGRAGMPERGNQRTARAFGMDGGMEHANLPGEHGRDASSREQPLRYVDHRSDENTAICDPGKIAERWLDVDWLLCRNPVGEPSWRPVESGTFPLAHGVTNRMGKLRAYGNALDLETASAFVACVKEICDGIRPVREFDL